MTEKLLNIIKSKYPLTAIDCGNMGKLKANGMNFTVSAYKADGLGHVSVMRAKGFFGLMKMDTLIINPTEIDLPLYSYDRIFAMGNDTLITELYDTFIEAQDCSSMESVKEEYPTLPQRDPGEHWYDSIKLPASISLKGKKAETPIFDELTLRHLEAYFTVNVPSVFPDDKRAKASVYVEGLLMKGGPSTDVFKKALGEEKTAYLFRNILFGTK